MRTRMAAAGAAAMTALAPIRRPRRGTARPRRGTAEPGTTRQAGRRLAAVAALSMAVTAAASVVAVTPAAAAPGCRVNYSVSSQRPGGFTGSIDITNLGDPLSNWSLTWTFSAGQQVTQAWNSTVSQSGSQVTARNAAWNGALGTNAGTNMGFNGSWNGNNPAPTNFALNGTVCNGTTQPSPTVGPTGSPTPGPSPSASPTPDPSVSPTGGPPTARSMGFIGCSMAENVAQGYVAIGGQRMWGPYGTGGAVVQSWTDTNSSSWQAFDRQSAQYGRPTAVWVQICIFAQAGATYNEVRQLITNARQHAAPGATIYISGQPLYDPGQTCFLAGANGPELTDGLARQAGNDAAQNVTYVGTFHLRSNEVSDGCHANTAGQQSLGRQAMAYWG